MTEDNYLTVQDVLAYAAQQGRKITRRAVQHAAAHGLIEGAFKVTERCWLFPVRAAQQYIDTPLKRGRKAEHGNTNTPAASA
jgi:hypothetical protein